MAHPEIVFIPVMGKSLTEFRKDTRDEDFGWNCKKTTKRDDLYLFYLGRPDFKIVGVGICSDAPDPEGEVNRSWDWGKKGERYWFCEFWPALSLAVPLSKGDIEGDPSLEDWWRGRPYRGGPKQIKVKSVAARLLDLIVDRNDNLADVLAPYRSHPLAKAASSTSRKPIIHSIDDKTEPPERVGRMVFHPKRDMAKALALKKKYNHQCQLCGTRISLPGASYAEVHHIRPLGGVHRGLDNHDNMLVLCPTCHLLFDFGALAIDPRTKCPTRFDGTPLDITHWKKRGDDHTLAQQNIKYAWRELFKPV